MSSPMRTPVSKIPMKESKMKPLLSAWALSLPLNRRWGSTDVW
jgi:hypothetical protein